MQLECEEVVEDVLADVTEAESRQREESCQNLLLRVENFFDECESNGIVCKRNFTCCQSCGHAEMIDEEEFEGDENAINYLFYHMQDYSFAKEGHVTMSIAHHLDNAKANFVLSIIGKYGEWSGNPDRRISIYRDPPTSNLSESSISPSAIHSQSRQPVVEMRAS